MRSVRTAAKKLSEKLQKFQKHIPFYYKINPQKGEPDTEHVYTTLPPEASPKENAFGPELSFGPLIAAHHERVNQDDKVAAILSA